MNHEFETIRSLITMLGEQHENWVNMSIATGRAKKSQGPMPKIEQVVIRCRVKQTNFGKFQGSFGKLLPGEFAFFKSKHARQWREASNSNPY